MPDDHRLSLTEHVPDDTAPVSPLVVLVPRFAGPGRQFRPGHRRLDDLHTVAYDRRGYHRSRNEMPVHESLDGHVHDLFAVIDGRPSVVVGHSYGGDIALAAAVPQRWLRTGSGRWRRSSRRCRGSGRGPRGRTATASPTHSPGTTIPGWRPNASSGAWSATRRGTGYPKRPRRPGGRTDRRWPPNSRRSGSASRPFDVSAVAVPAIFGRGTESLPHHRASADWLVANVPGAELIEIQGAAHGAHLTHPDAFAQFVRAGVRRAGPAPSDTTAQTGRRGPAAGRTDPVHLLVTGSSGLIGTPLVDAALVRGDTVTRLVRATSAFARRGRG